MLREKLLEKEGKVRVQAAEDKVIEALRCPRSSHGTEDWQRRLDWSNQSTGGGVVGGGGEGEVRLRVMKQVKSCSTTQKKPLNLTPSSPTVTDDPKITCSQ